MAATFFILKHGIAPPELAKQSDAVRLMFWGWVTDLGLRRKDWELAHGLNAKGEPLPGVRPATRKNRKSAMTPSGKGDPAAPYLMPGKGLSRTRSLLAGKPHRDHAEFFWRFDPWTGDQWGRILHHHAQRGTAYNVVGLSPLGVRWVAEKARKLWREWLKSGDGKPMKVAGGPSGPAGPAPAYPAGTTNLKHATFGIGTTREQAERAIREGRSSGFRTIEEWEALWRSKAAPITPAAGTRAAWSVRQGESNILLQRVWGGTARPGPAAPPVPVPPPKPKPKPRPAVAALLPAPAPVEPPPGGPRFADGVVTAAKGVKIVDGTPDALRKTAEDTLAAIGRVHGIPEGWDGWAKFREYRPEVDDADFKTTPRGFYRASTREVVARHDIDETAMTVAHEFGHHVDAGIAARDGKPTFVGVNPRLAAFDEAARKSAKIRKLRESRERAIRLALEERAKLARAKTDAERDAARRDLLDYRGFARYDRYLLRPWEVWARAYSFWIGQRGGPGAVADDYAELRKVNGATYSPHVWEDEDFKPLATEIEKVFRELGWLPQ